MTVVALHSVTKAYGPACALVGVSCEFHEGLVTVIQGPNGSGKSTLRPLNRRHPHAPYIWGRRPRHPGKAARGGYRRSLGWVGHQSLFVTSTSPVGRTSNSLRNSTDVIRRRLGDKPRSASNWVPSSSGPSEPILAGKGNASHWPGRWFTGRRCFSWTSRRRAWTRRRRRG